MIVAVCTAAAAIAFIALVIYLIRLLRTARTSLCLANETLEAMRSRLEETGAETLRLLRSTEELVQETGRQLHKVTPLCDSLRQAGEASSQAAAAFKKVSGSVSRTATGIEARLHRHQEQIADVSEWTALGMQLLQQWLTHRSEERNRHHMREDEENV